MTTTEVQPEFLPACPIGRVRTDPINPRTHMTVDADFVASIAAGILEPLIVRVDPANPQLLDVGPVDFLIVAGERRYTAAVQAEMLTVPVIVRHDITTDAEALVAMVVENGQRESLPPLDEARALNVLVTDHGMSQRDAAKAIGREQGTVSKRLSLLKLPTRAQQLLDSGRITVKTALGLTGLVKHNDRMSNVLDWAAEHGDATDQDIGLRIEAHLGAVALEKERAKAAKNGDAAPAPREGVAAAETIGPSEAFKEARGTVVPDDTAAAQTYTDALADIVIAEAARAYVAARVALDNDNYTGDQLEQIGHVDLCWAALLAACGHAVPTEDVTTIDDAPPAPITVHCFTCDHEVTDADPQAAHDAMEEHYAEAHAKVIEEIAGPTPDISTIDDQQPDLEQPWRGYDAFGTNALLKVLTSPRGVASTPDVLANVIAYERANDNRTQIIDAAQQRLDQLASVNA